MSNYLGRPTGSNVHWVWNGSAWATQPYGGGSSAGGIAAPWQTAFDIDFTTQTSASFSTNGQGALAGYTWDFQNMSSADSIGIRPGVGLVLDPNAVSTDFFLLFILPLA